jgi:hypothetical protein
MNRQENMSEPKAESEIGMTKMQSMNGVKESVEGKKQTPYRLALFIKVYRHPEEVSAIADHLPAFE